MRTYRNFDYCPGIHTKLDSESLKKAILKRQDIRDIYIESKKAMKRKWKWTQIERVLTRLIEAWDKWTACFSFAMIDWILQYGTRIRELRHVLNNNWFEIVCSMEYDNWEKHSSYMLVKSEE